MRKGEIYASSEQEGCKAVQRAVCLDGPVGDANKQGSSLLVVRIMTQDPPAPILSRMAGTGWARGAAQPDPSGGERREEGLLEENLLAARIPSGERAKRKNAIERRREAGVLP